MPTRTLRLLLAVTLIPALFACTTPKQPPIPMGNLRIGTAFYTQPKDTGDLLAGYMTDDISPVNEQVLGEMDSLWAQTLRSKTKRAYMEGGNAVECAKTVQAAEGQRAALRRWAAVGRCMGVDLLIVPQVIEWRERDGGEYGVVKPAKVVMDTYVIDVRNETLISRSRYDETQSALASNLLEADKFVKRGGKWVTAHDLAQEGMEKAIKDLGL